MAILGYGSLSCGKHFKEKTHNKPMKTMKTTSLLAASALLISATALPAATTLVHWGESGGDTGIVPANTTGSLSTTYTDGASINPTVGASYYPSNTDRTPTYNGAHTTSGTTHQMQDRTAPGDRMFIQGSGAVGVEAMFAWESGVHTLSSSTGYKDYNFTWEGQLRSGSDTGSTRFLLEDSAGQWHISQSFSVTAPASGLDSFSGSASSLSWSSYTPFSAGVDTIGAASTPDIVSAQSFGFFVESTATISNTGVAMEHFLVTAVPEPSSTALLGLGGLALALRRRRS